VQYKRLIQSFNNLTIIDNLIGSNRDFYTSPPLSNITARRNWFRITLQISQFLGRPLEAVRAGIFVAVIAMLLIAWPGRGFAQTDEIQVYDAAPRRIGAGSLGASH
jgi:hypothetical protein